MKLIIEIPKEYYELYKSAWEHLDHLHWAHDFNFTQELAIANGIPIPENHGKLIDASQLLTVTECLEDGTERCYVPYEYIEDAPSILDMEGEE